MKVTEIQISSDDDLFVPNYGCPQGTSANVQELAIAVPMEQVRWPQGTHDNLQELAMVVPMGEQVRNSNTFNVQQLAYEVGVME
jgi:hypothetical protein